MPKVIADGEHIGTAEEHFYVIGDEHQEHQALADNEEEDIKKGGRFEVGNDDDAELYQVPILVCVALLLWI